MAVSWGIMLPVGVFLPRFFKRFNPMWFKIHRALQTVGLIVAIVGFAFGINVGSRTEIAHRGIGITGKPI